MGNIAMANCLGKTNKKRRFYPPNKILNCVGEVVRQTEIAETS